MRHLKKGRKFGRERDQRRALMKHLASAFFVEGKIKTTEARAKELRPFVEKMITRAKNPTLANRRILARILGPRALDQATSRAKNIDRQGGYTRITKLGPRISDSSRMAVIEFIG